MEILIIEDELPAARRMERMILKEEPSWTINRIIDSLETAVGYLKTKPKVDLIFMDIQLADGYSFEIFEQVDVQVPVIFATAYDEYAVQAFKVNGLDYLLKPIEKEELCRAITKFKEYSFTNKLDYSELLTLIKAKEATIKERFLVKKGDELKFIETKDIAYFQSDTGYVNITTHQGERFLIDFTLDYLRDQLSVQYFFQINRQFIVNVKSISVINTWFNNRLKLKLTPSVDTDVVVSRDRVKAFKVWLGG